MARDRQIFFLCVVLMFITGIAVLKYFPYKYLKVSSTSNSFVTNFRSISKENEVPVSTEAKKIKNARTNIVINSIEKTNFSNFIYDTKSAPQVTPKTKKRIKRETVSDNMHNDIFAWNFNVNVTHNHNGKLKHETIKINQNTSQGKELSGLSIYAAAQEPKNSAFSKLQAAFQSAGIFIKNFFTGDEENVINDIDVSDKTVIQSFNKWTLEKSDEEVTKSLIDNSKSLTSQSEILKNHITQPNNELLEPSEQTQLNSMPVEEDSENNSFNPNNRTGRIFFPTFLFGGKPLRTTVTTIATTAIKLETISEDDLSRNVATNTNFFNADNSVLGNENLQQESIQSPDSLSETERSVTDLNEQNTKLNSGIVSRKDCPDCDADLKPTDLLDNLQDKTQNVVQEMTTHPTKQIFSDEMLEHLCQVFLDNLVESSPKEENSETLDIQNEKNRLKSSQKPILDGLFLSNPQDEVSERDISIVSDSSLTNNEGSETESIVLSRESRFLNFFGLGSGRSAIIENESDLIEGSTDKHKFVALPNFLDCVQFFSRKRKINISPTSNPISESVDTLSSKSQDHLSQPTIIQNSVLTRKINISPTSNPISESVDTLSSKSQDHLSHPTIIQNSVLTTSQKNSNSESNFNEDLNSFGNETFTLSKDIFITKSEDIKTESYDDMNKWRVSEGTDPGNRVQTESEREGRLFSFLGFGSGSDQDSVSRRFFNFFGSGQRSLDTLDNGNDFVTDFASNKPFQDKDEFSGDGREISDTNIIENLSSTPGQERLFNLFGFAGSGSGRELIENTDLIVTEFNTNVDDECGDDCSDVAEQSHKCHENDECTLRNFHDPENSTTVKDVITTLKYEEYEYNCSDCYYENQKHDEDYKTDTYLKNLKAGHEINTSVIIDQDDEGHRVTEFPLSSAVNDADYHKTTLHTLEDYITTENSYESHETTTEIKSRRFMGPIFLTGSGEGGLFEDDGGPIHLVEEESTVSPIVRRRGRLDDPTDMIDPCDDCMDFSDLFEGNFDMFMNQSSSTSTSPSNSSLVTDSIFSMSRPVDEITINRETEETNSFPPKTFSKPPNATHIPAQVEPRFCVSARECNHTLNERCIISINSSSICDCGRSFVRQRETGKCVAKKLVETSLKLPAEEFDTDLQNPDSARYKEMSEKSKEMMWHLLSETPDVLQIVADVDVIGFRSGSLIVNLELVLAVEKESEIETADRIEVELQKALQDKELEKKVILDIKNASFLSVKSERNPCKSSELNYCSKNADCLWNEAHPGLFNCLCKEHYHDVSEFPFYPGEDCIAKCPISYCASYGHCEVTENGKFYCLCKGFHFGQRCEVSGTVVFGSLSFVALICLIVLCAVVIKLKHRSRNFYGRTPTFRRSEEIVPSHAIADGRVSDVIALGDRRMQASKFAYISTPVQVPAIKVTRPTFNDSSISFNSSYDVSPASEKESQKS